MTEKEKRLVEENHNLIYFYLNRHNLDAEEFYDIAAIGLIEAARTYKEEKANFSTYAVFCIGNEIKTEYKKRTLKREIPKSLIMSESQAIGNLENTYLTKIKSKTENLEEKICTEDLIKKTMRKLDDRKKKIMIMLIDGYKMSDIAKELNVSHQRVQQIRKDIKKVMLEEMAYD